MSKSGLNDFLLEIIHREEIKTILNRRFVLPFYIPIISLICSFLIIRPDKKKNFFLNNYQLFLNILLGQTNH